MPEKDSPQGHNQPLPDHAGDASPHCTPIQYATVILHPGPDGFYPDYQALTEQASVTREFIHQIHLLPDGTIVGLYQLWCDVDELMSIYDARPHVLAYNITENTDGVATVYEHTVATSSVKSLLENIHQSTLILDFPLIFTDDGGLRVTVIGPEPTLHQALSATPNRVTIDLKEVGTYPSEQHALGAQLTDRQYQILQLAVTQGYYAVPRRATLSDLAEEMEITASTIATHLQKIEATIFAETVR